MMRALFWLAARGRYVLLTGLALGIGVPPLARFMEPAIVPLIAALLFLAAVRIGPSAARPRWPDVPRYLVLTLAFQTVMPLVALAILTALGWAETTIGIGVVLMLAAGPVMGGPGLAILAGADPVPVLRQLVIGTALLPLTALPVFWFLPIFDDVPGTLLAGAKLFGIIALAGGSGFAVRAFLPGLGAVRAVRANDGLGALAMGLVVIGLTSAVGPALLTNEPVFWLVVGVTLILNFGTQLAVFAGFRAAGAGDGAAAMGLIAGNRNMGLFLGALPPDLAGTLLLFIGCYQVPMFLTPLVMIRLYRASAQP
jgi:hypothetical protein